MITPVLREGREGWSQDKVASSSIWGNHGSVLRDVIKGEVLCVKTVPRQKKVENHWRKKKYQCDMSL